MSCGDHCEAEEFTGNSKRYKAVLAAVIAINALAFVALAGGSLLEGSAALGANALDFFADAATYTISLWVIGRSAGTRAGAALFKGVTLAAVAAWILGFAVWRAFAGTPPEGLVISGLAALGFVANLVAAGLLLRYREGDANVRSVWLCTRNDLVESIVVVIAGGLVLLTGSRWPDLLAGGALAFIFLQSAYAIVTQARGELREA